MNGFSNDWFGNGGFRTMGAGVGDAPASAAPIPTQVFTPWSHGTPAPLAASPREMPAPRLQTPHFGPAHSFAMMGGGAPGFLGAVRLARRP